MSHLTIYNTLSKKKEAFHPLEPGKVKMYVCGPTVYHDLHIGNFRGAIFFNLVRNWLKKRGFAVIYAYNYTDVDDKIIQRAQEEEATPQTISTRYIEAFERDFKRLGLKPHDKNPKATDFIPQIIKTIEKIIASGQAYVVEGEVFYSIDHCTSYGQLSGQKEEELRAGERVEVDKRKKNPLDFTLWKPSKEGEPSWESPWGPGRPGWHIECTSMIQGLLGDTIDIHGGGQDLIFPHHENEIAQGEAASGHHPYCRYWMHNHLLKVDGQKMSKSLGNVAIARNFMDEYHPEVLKYLMLSVHYRRPLNLDREKMGQVLTELSRIYEALRLAHRVLKQTKQQRPSSTSTSASTPKEWMNRLSLAKTKVAQALDDDFNTREALAQVFEVVRDFNRLDLLKKIKKASGGGENDMAQAFVDWLEELSGVMALFSHPPEEFLQTLDDIWLREHNLERAFIDELVAKRQEARLAKDFAQADHLRNELARLGIDVHDDSASGTTWKVRRFIFL